MRIQEEVRVIYVGGYPLQEIAQVYADTRN